MVVDQPLDNSSSRIAAGLFNPVTGRKMAKTWLADHLFPALHAFYQDVSQITGGNFFFPLNLYRPFLSIEEQNEWMARSADPAYAPYVNAITTGPSIKEIKDEYGGLMLRQCGFLDTRSYIRSVSEWIRKEGVLLHEKFDHDQLQIGTSVRYKDYTANKIIFCEGVHDNPWFGWLPIRPLKGETITIKSSFREKIIINRGVYILPANEDGLQRVGATYNFQDKIPSITDTARIELQNKLSDLISFDFTVVDHQWGWRPTTPDRRPLLGAHPELDSLVVFNGLGTKGVSLAPYFSEVLIRWIENGEPLNKDVDIERYKSLYWKSPK